MPEVGRLFQVVEQIRGSNDLGIREGQPVGANGRRRCILVRNERIEAEGVFDQVRAAVAVRVRVGPGYGGVGQLRRGEMRRLPFGKRQRMPGGGGKQEPGR